MARKILFITTDQQRFDTLGCNGGELSRTPVLDGLAARGFRYERAHPQSVVCMPSRSTMITGQYPSTHGVWMNGVSLPQDAPSVAEELSNAGYRSALIGKPHFEPFVDPFAQFPQNSLASTGQSAPYRGFDYVAFATHGAQGTLHYSRWLAQKYPEHVGSYYVTVDRNLEVSAVGGGQSGAPQVWDNAVPLEAYHTTWVAQETTDWLQSLEGNDDWFCWMSFPDPHHPWDPPESELHRIPNNDVPLPAGYPRTDAERLKILDGKPKHWRQWYEGELTSNYEAPHGWVPATLTEDQIREVNARNAIEIELIDEAIGRVLETIDARGWADDVDIIFTTDHGEFQGDYGFLFKGPYHVDSLMRLPLIWAPAPNARHTPAVVDRPVGLVDLAPTFCDIANVEIPAWMEGKPLPVNNDDADARGHERVLTQWDSEFFGVSIYLRTITRDGWTCTAYLPSTIYDGTEGELYNLEQDPHQQHNLFDDPGYRAIRDDLLDDLREHHPTSTGEKLPLVAPV